MTARELVLQRLARLARIERNKPGCIKQTTMLWAFMAAVK